MHVCVGVGSEGVGGGRVGKQDRGSEIGEAARRLEMPTAAEQEVGIVAGREGCV